MRTDNIRLAAFLLTKGHAIRGVEIVPEGYGLVTFSDDAQSDAELFERGAMAPAEALLASYRTLIRQLELRNPHKHGGGGVRGLQRRSRPREGSRRSRRFPTFLTGS